MVNALTPMIQQFVRENDDVLAVGIGAASVEDGIKCNSMTGVDIWTEKIAPILEKSRIKLVKANVMELLDVFEPKSYDVVMALDLIEHLDKCDGRLLIPACEAVARKSVVFYTPLKWDTNRSGVEGGDPSAWHYGNPYNYHLSLWTKEDFESLGYSTYLIYPSPMSPEGIIAVKIVEGQKICQKKV